MKTFFFTTLFRFVVFAGGWIYLSGFQSELLYNTLGAMNPATEAVNNCMSGMDSLSSGLNTKLDTILTELKQAQGTDIIYPFGTTPTPTTTGTVRVIENLIDTTTTGSAN